MHPTAILLLTLSAAALAISAASGISCYVCNSLVDKDCDAKSVPAAYMVNCTTGRSVGPDKVALPEAQVCWKQTQDVVGLAIVDRTCGPPMDGSYHCYYRVGTKKIKITYCVCNGNNCNPAGRLGAASWGATLAAACLVAVATLWL